MHTGLTAPPKSQNKHKEDKRAIIEGRTLRKIIFLGKKFFTKTVRAPTSLEAQLYGASVLVSRKS